MLLPGDPRTNTTHNDYTSDATQELPVPPRTSAVQPLRGSGGPLMLRRRQRGDGRGGSGGGGTVGGTG